MRKQLKEFWGDMTVKYLLLIILITIGTISWMYFYQEFTKINRDAEWAWHEVQQIQQQNEKKDLPKSYDDAQEVSASTEVKPIEERESLKNSPTPLGEIEKIIYEVFGKDDYQTAKAVAFAESRLNPIATHTNTNGTTDCGVFQINSIHGLTNCQDARTNIEYAHKLFQRRGWQPWVAYTSGKYLAYLDE